MSENKEKLAMADAMRHKTAAVTLLVMVCASAGFGGGYLGSKSHTRLTSSDNPPSSKANQKAALGESELISAIAKRVAPSVVSVDVTGQSAPQLDFFGYTTTQQLASAGTGIIVSDDGYILTNRHVVPAGTTSVSVTLSDGTKFDAVEVVGRTGANDPLDAAFLKIKDLKGKKLQKATLGDSTKAQVGDKVVAIGNALGQFQNTVTSGIISGFGRNVQAGPGGADGSDALQNLFQTDAAINEGNSGGPLLNIGGEVIGINTAIAAGGAQNIGFSIPINDLQSLIKSVLSKGKVEHPYLGIRYVALTDDYAYRNNLSVKRGAYIISSSTGKAAITPGSPAAKAGLKEKDAIIKIDGTAIDENNSVSSLLGRKAVGDDISIAIIRDGKEQTLKAKLEAAPKD